MAANLLTPTLTFKWCHRQKQSGFTWHISSCLFISILDIKAKLDNCFGLTLSLWCITSLKSAIVVEKWHHLLLNWSPISLFLPWYFLCHRDEGFEEKWKISDPLCSLCPDWLVHTALLSDRWRQYELISSPCYDSPLPTTECLQPFGLSSM